MKITLKDGSVKEYAEPDVRHRHCKRHQRRPGESGMCWVRLTVRKKISVP